MTFTHTTLKQAIQDWTENSETTFVNNLDVFITNAEERILKMVDLDFFRKNVTATFVSGSPYLNVPGDYLASFSLGYTKTNGDKDFLMQKDVNFLQEFHPDASDTGEPKYYALFDVNNFLIAPTPNSNYAVELHYYYRPNSITGSAGTSWLGDNSPNTLLYGSLVEAYTFMKGEPDMLQLYETRFLQNIARLKNYGEGVENTDAYREGLVRIPKT